MEKLLEKYLPGYVADEKLINEANRAIRLERKHFDWLINLLASTLETIKATDSNRKAAIEVFANGLEGTNSTFNRERFIRTAYQKILKDKNVEEPEVPNRRQQELPMEESLDEKKKKKMEMKKCVNPECGASMPVYFNECPKCGAKQKAKEEVEKEVKKEEKK
jgi:hypothetical protein